MSGSACFSHSNSPQHIRCRPEISQHSRLKQARSHWTFSCTSSSASWPARTSKDMKLMKPPRPAPPPGSWNVAPSCCSSNPRTTVFCAWVCMYNPRQLDRNVVLLTGWCRFRNATGSAPRRCRLTNEHNARKCLGKGIRQARIVSVHRKQPWWLGHATDLQHSDFRARDCGFSCIVLAANPKVHVGSAIHILGQSKLVQIYSVLERSSILSSSRPTNSLLTL